MKCPKCGKVKPDIMPSCGLGWGGIQKLGGCVCDADVIQR